ncbi:MAG: zinc ribbon domain-containing protein [Caldilineales bacterium]
MVLVVVGSVLLLAVALMAVAWPLLQERRGLLAADLAVEALPLADPLVDLQTQRDAIYQAIRELRFDQQVGKVSAADFTVFDAQLRGQAARVLRQIDALAQAEADPALQNSLEVEIAGLRQVKDAPVSTLNFCPQCGQRLHKTDRFCSGCGSALA